MMLQVGLAADYKSRSQTAADAAALAGAIEVKREIIAAYAMDHQLQPEEINMALVCAQAAIYAARNRAHDHDCQHAQYDIKVKVIGNDQLRASATPRSSTATTPRPRRAPRRGASAAAAASSAPAAAACRSAAGAAAR